MSLEDDLLAAADTLVEAWHLLRGGHVERTARLADDAVELVIKTLVPLPEEFRRQKGRPNDMYGYRQAEAERLFDIPQTETKQLHHDRLLDRFREKRPGGPPVVLTEPQAMRALESATAIIEKILASTYCAAQVPADTRARVLERLARRNAPSMEEELLEVVEYNVGWGHYNQALKARLLRLDSVFATRPSTVGELHHARVVTLRAHMAMNEGTPSGAEGAIGLAERAERIWTARQSAARVIHTLKIQSIGWRMLKDPARGVPLMDRAQDVVGDSPGLQDEVNSERSSLLGALGDADGAARVLRDTLDRYHVDGKTVQEGRTFQQIGKAQMAAGNLIQAEQTLLRGHELTPPDYLIAECVGANALAELYARMGDKREAHIWADRVEHLARGLGFAHQLSQLQEMMLRYPAIW